MVRLSCEQCRSLPELASVPLTLFMRVLANNLFAFPEMEAILWYYHHLLKEIQEHTRWDVKQEIRPCRQWQSLFIFKWVSHSWITRQCSTRKCVWCWKVHKADWIFLKYSPENSIKPRLILDRLKVSGSSPYFTCISDGCPKPTLQWSE